MSKNKVSLSQLLSRPDNELRTLDAAQTAQRAGFILEAQLEKDAPWFTVKAVERRSGFLFVQLSGGAWHKPYTTIFHRSMTDYNAALRQRKENV